MTQRWQRIEEVFDRALRLDSKERRAFVEDECSEEPDVRAEVLAMLDAHERGLSSDVERRLLQGSEGREDVDPLLGREVGNYRLVELIGEGGMGRVYRAERADAQYEQQVAIKLVRGGVFSSALTERFRLERQLLARLEHPNIAGLLDGGVTDDGFQYLVMPYVDGLPITEACDRERLDVGARLDLFTRVCEAVRYAHGHLIVHRDLKPSNILVTAEGEVKLLDFGIAKLLDPSAVDLPLEETRTMHRVLTPLNAAPEQVRGEAITTATDVYALGLLLYEMLVGRPAHSFASRTAAEIERVVCTEPVRSLSRSLERVAEDDGESPEAEHVATLRSTTLAQLRRTVGGDLERIVLMALQKEPARRYASAGDLADDVERFVSGLPVRAQDDTLGYRVRRFVARHPWGVAAATAFVAVLVAFGSLMALQARRLADERDRSDVERRKSEQVVATLVELFETGDPSVARGDTVPVADFLQAAEEKADALAGQPEVQARLLNVLGRIHLTRGQAVRALELQERAWAIQERLEGYASEGGLQMFHALARAHLDVGEMDEARTLIEESVALHEERYGSSSAETAVALTALVLVLPVDERGPVLERVVEIRRDVLEPDDPRTASSLGALADNLGPDRREEAAALREESAHILEVAYGRDHPETLTALHNLASVKPLGERIELLEEVVEIRRRVLGERSAAVAMTWNNLGVSYANRGELGRGTEAFRQAYAILVESAGEDAFHSRNTARNIARMLQVDGQLEESLEYYDLALGEGLLPTPESMILAQRSVAEMRAGRFVEAERSALRALALAREHPLEEGAFDRRVSMALTSLGKLQLARGEAESAETSLRRATEVWTEGGERWSNDLADARVAHGCALVELRRYAEGARLLEASLPVLEAWPFVEAPDLRLARVALATAQATADRPGDRR